MRARPQLAFLAAFVAIVALGYGHTLGYPFHFDDFSSIRDNAALRAPDDPGAIWRFRPSRSVVHLSLAWNLALGESTAGLRAVNLLIHAAASLLVGWIAAALWRRSSGSSPASPDPERTPAAGAPGAGKSRRARPRRSPAPAEPARPVLIAIPGHAPAAAQVGAIAALLFAAHPLATQAVTYIVQRTTSLAALLELVAVAGYLRARAGGSARWWAASWAAGILAAGTKEMSVALPALVLLIEAGLRGAGVQGRARAWHFVPYCIVPPLVGWMASLPAGELGRAPVGLRETDDVARSTYLLTQLVVIPRYLALAVWPAAQTLDPDVRWIRGFEPIALLGLAGLAALAIAAFALRRRLPLVTIGVLWCLVALIPESSVIPIRDAMVEHRMYLPLAGLAWAGAALLEAAARVLPPASARRGLWLPCAALVVAITLATATHARNRVWQDELSLWTDAATRAPRKARPHNNRGLALEELGRVAEAESAFRRAIAVEPDYVYGRINLGRLYGMNGRPGDALAVLREAERIEPGNPAVLNNLGTAWWALGDTARAAAAYEQVLRVEPGAPDAAVNLQRMRAGTGVSRP